MHTSSPRSASRLASSLRLAFVALSLGVGCYGGDPTATAVQEAALCGEDLVVPTTYTCALALTNIGSSGAFTAAGAAGAGGECTVTCECTWGRISEAPSCGANRMAEGAAAPTCPERTVSRYRFAVLSDVRDEATCADLGRRPTDACAQVCKLAATDPTALRHDGLASDVLLRLQQEGNPVTIESGAPIVQQRSELMYCCAPNPLRRTATPGVSAEPEDAPAISVAPASEPRR